MIYLHPNGQIEFVDGEHIVSIRTIYAADLADFLGPPDQGKDDETPNG